MPLRPFRALLALAALAVAGCATGADPNNPLIGRWTMTAPVGPGFSLGTYEFSRSSMEALGFEQEVAYSVNGNRVTVVPRSFGPTLEVTMIDRNTAEFADPVTGSPFTLRRLEGGSGWF